MLSVDRELLESLHSHPDCPVEFIDHLRRAISQPAGNAFKRCAILKECNVKSSPASGARINAIDKPITRRVCHGCVGLPRDVFCPVCDDEHPEPVVTIANLILAAHEVRGFPAVKGYLLRELADRLNGVKP